MGTRWDGLVRRVVAIYKYSIPIVEAIPIATASGNRSTIGMGFVKVFVLAIDFVVAIIVTSTTTMIPDTSPWPALSVSWGTLSANPNPNRSIMFIVDASGSMNDRLNGSTRMKVAVQKLDEFIRKLPPETEMGLVAYGNRIPGCDSARLYTNLKRGGGKEILAKLPLLLPAGSTPIARTLELVNKHILAGHPYTEIILVSDGVESCDGDPIAEVAKIRRSNPQTKVHVLGLDVPVHEERDLQHLAVAGSGRYLSVRSGESLQKALDSIWTGEVYPWMESELADVKSPIQSPEKPKPTDNLKLPENSKPTDKSNLAKPFIRITEIERVKPRDSNLMAQNMDYIVWYEYEGTEDSYEDIAHSALLGFYPESSPVSDLLPPRRIPQSPSIQKIATVDHGRRAGKGYVRIQVPENFPFRVSAELWNMEGIPTVVAVSDEKTSRSAKNTETFDQIFR